MEKITKKAAILILENFWLKSGKIIKKTNLKFIKVNVFFTFEAKIRIAAKKVKKS